MPEASNNVLQNGVGGEFGNNFVIKQTGNGIVTANQASEE